MTNRDQDLIEQMKEAAAKATRGPWRVVQRRHATGYARFVMAGEYPIARLHSTGDSGANGNTEANAALIALCSPDNILSLIDRLSTLQSELDEARGALEPFANLAYGYDDNLDPDDRPVGPFKLGLCRRARAALSQKETGR